MAAFLDMEGAFNNIEISTIVGSLSHGGIDDLTCGWIGSMPLNRMITASNGSATLTGLVGKVRESILRRIRKYRHSTGRCLLPNGVDGGAKWNTTSTQWTRSESSGICRRHSIDGIRNVSFHNQWDYAKSPTKVTRMGRKQLTLFTSKTKIPQFKLLYQTELEN